MEKHLVIFQPSGQRGRVEKGKNLLEVSRELGVDIERISSRVSDEQIAERFFSPREVAALRALPKSRQQEAFFTCWTLST